MKGTEPERARDAALVLPVAAALCLCPPIILIFAAPTLVGGVPLIVAYLFGIWAAIILATFLTSRQLETSGTAPGADGAGGDEAGEMSEPG